MLIGEIEARAAEIAEYVITTGATVRAAAKHFGISKSTVHKDLTERLKHSDTELYKRVSEVLAKNRAERHIRGGNATKRKYDFARKQNGKGGYVLDKVRQSK